jgi:hypothetical protein
MLRERCLRPANIREFIAFNAQYPKQNHYPVVALGSMGIEKITDNMNYQVVPSLTLFGSDRELCFDRVENGWHDYDCFLAVRE